MRPPLDSFTTPLRSSARPRRRGCSLQAPREYGGEESRFQAEAWLVSQTRVPPAIWISTVVGDQAATGVLAFWQRDESGLRPLLRIEERGLGGHTYVRARV